jgi:hypothetical protein
MSVQEILIDWLKSHGYDGLCLPREACGCGINDLCPCGYSCDDCEPAYAVTITEEMLTPHYDEKGEAHCLDTDGQVGDIIYMEEKPITKGG